MEYRKRVLIIFYISMLGLTRHDWSDLHLWAGLAMLAAVTIHLALHWRWVVCAIRRYAQIAICRADEYAAA